MGRCDSSEADMRWLPHRTLHGLDLECAPCRVPNDCEGSGTLRAPGQASRITVRLRPKWEMGRECRSRDGENSRHLQGYYTKLETVTYYYTIGGAAI